MKQNNTYNDEALRIIMQKKAEVSEQFKLSESFADRLMERIKSEEITPKQRSKTVWLDFVSAISTVAAVLLIGFFITLHLPSSEKNENTYTYYNIGNLPKKSTLEQVYTSYLGQKNKKEISYTHLRQMLYEKK